MNYLELCNEVLVRMREDEITDIADVDNEPQQKLVTRFVQDAYDFVLKAHNWNSQRKEWKIPIVEGQNIYTLPVSSEGASVYSVELKDGCNKKNDMIEVDAPGMARLDECQTGVPYYYAPSRVVNGQLGLEIWPMPVIPKEPDPEPGPGPGPGPNDPCPCSCGKFTFNPLECAPGLITGGLYDMADTRPITNGVFLNSDGSQGRVQEWLNGAPSNLAPDINGRAEVFYNGKKFYGFMDLNGAQGRHWTNGATNYEGQPFEKEFFDTQEFCVLVGHTGNQQLADPPLIETPDVRTGVPGSANGQVWFRAGALLLDSDNDTVLNGSGGAFVVERSSPSTVRYNQGNTLGGSDYITVNVPSEVMDPDDKFMWISVKFEYGVESLGPAKDTIPGYDNPGFWGFRDYARATLYINGWLAAKDIYCNSNAGYGQSDPARYTQVFVGNDTNGNEIEPTNLKFGNPQTKNGGVDASTLPSMFLIRPSLGSNELFAVYMDHGPGAVDLPNTELGKNLKRIDPNHTPADTCDCPELPKPPGVDRMAILSSETRSGQYATVNGFLTNESGGASTMPSGQYQNDYPVARLGSTDGTQGQTYLPFKGFRNHTYWATASADLTFSPDEGPGEFYGIPYSDTYPENPVRGNPKLSQDWEIAVYLDFGMSASPLDADYLRLEIGGSVNAWWNTTNVSWTQTGGLNGSRLTLNGDGEVKWESGSALSISPSQPLTQLADRNQMTGWYILSCKQEVEWVNAGPVYSEWTGTATHSIEVPWGYTYSETMYEDGYASGTGITNILRTGTAYGSGPGASLNTQGLGSADKIVAGAVIYADKTKGETIPRDVLTWYEQQRADYVAPPAPTTTPLTTEEIPDIPIGGPIALTGDELVVNGYGMAPKLVANTDECEIPEQVVLYYALSLASRERGEVGGMAAAEIFALSKQYLADAIARDIGNSRHEYTWETV